jgi:hypothetical protein
MLGKTLFGNVIKTAKFATVVIFLVLIRSISDPLRLQYYSKTLLTFNEIKPFLIGSLIAASGLLLMTSLFYFRKYNMIIATCIFTIILMLIVKKVYLF